MPEVRTQERRKKTADNEENARGSERERGKTRFTVTRRYLPIESSRTVLRATGGTGWCTSGRGCTYRAYASDTLGQNARRSVHREYDGVQPPLPPLNTTHQRMCPLVRGQGSAEKVARVSSTPKTSPSSSKTEDWVPHATAMRESQERKQKQKACNWSPGAANYATSPSPFSPARALGRSKSRTAKKEREQRQKQKERNQERALSRRHQIPFLRDLS